MIFQRTHKGLLYPSIGIGIVYRGRFPSFKRTASLVSVNLLRSEMVRRSTIWLCCLLGLCSSLCAQVPVFINELHYDNAAVDTAEGVEIAGPAGTNLSCFRIYLYNGAVSSAAVVYDSVVLSGVIPDQCNGFGTLNFPVNLPRQIQNGGNDGMSLVFRPTFAGCGAPGVPRVVQLLSYEGIFTAHANPASNLGGLAAGMTSTDIGVFESSSTLTGLSLQLTGAGSLYSDFTWTTPAAATRGNLNNGQTFGGLVCGTGPVIPTELRFHTTPSGCILPGGSFSFQVCGTNASGFTAISYNSPITLSLLSGPGVLSGVTTQTALFGCATFPGLSLSAAGTYVFRATDGVRSDTSVFVYVSPTCTTCPNLDAVLVDACGAQEGRNEILFFNSGDYAIPVDPNAFSINYGTTVTPATGYTNSITSNLPYIAALNALAGCSLFHDALTETPIPPNTNFLVMSYTPLTTYNFAAWCSLGSVYVIFSNDPDWDLASGNWKNCVDCLPLGPGTTPRFFHTDFSGLGGGTGCDFTYNYTPCSDLLCNGNGDGIDFGYGGGSPTASWTECTPTNVLPVEYAMALSAARDGIDVRLNWETSTESNSSYFEIERGLHPEGPFVALGRRGAAGTSTSAHSYDWRDVRAPQARLWYRLAQVDNNGASHYSQVVTVAELSSHAQLSITHSGRDYHFLVTGSGDVRLEIYDAAGKLQRSVRADNGSLEVDLAALQVGVYFYRMTIGQEAFTGKIPVID